MDINKKVNITELIRNNNYLNNKEVIKILIVFAIPTIIEQIAITMMQFIDTAMIGHLGTAATAAIGVTTSTTMLFNGVFAAISVGFTVQLSQKIGANNINEAKSIISQGILFVTTLGCIMSFIGIILSSKLPILLGVNKEVSHNCEMYFKTISIFFPFVFGVNLFSGIIRARGDIKTPMVLNILMGILNVIFNFYFIYPSFNIKFLGISIKCMGYGVIGAALGTGISETLVFTLYLTILFFKENPTKISLNQKFKFTKSCIVGVLNIGLPVFLERIVMSSAQIVLTIIVAKLGTVAIASNTICMNAESLCYLPGFGIASAVTVLLGQSIGAKNQYLAKKFGIIGNYIGMIIMGILGITMFIFSKELISIFTLDCEVIDIGSKILKIAALSEPFFAASIVIAGAFRGAGKSKLPFFINLFTMWCIRIPICYFMANNFSIIGVWIGIVFEIFLRGIISMVLLYKTF